MKIQNLVDSSSPLALSVSSKDCSRAAPSANDSLNTYGHLVEEAFQARSTLHKAAQRCWMLMPVVSQQKAKATGHIGKAD